MATPNKTQLVAATAATGTPLFVIALRTQVHAMPQPEVVKMITVSAYGRREDVATTSTAEAVAHPVKPVGAQRIGQAIEQPRSARPA